MQNYTKTGKNSKQKGTKTKMKSFFIGSTKGSLDTQHPGHKEHSKDRAAMGELTHFFSVLFNAEEIGKLHLEFKQLQDQMYIK